MPTSNFHDVTAAVAVIMTVVVVGAGAAGAGAGAGAGAAAAAGNGGGVGVRYGCFAVMPWPGTTGGTVSVVQMVVWFPSTCTIRRAPVSVA